MNLSKIIIAILIFIGFLYNKEIIILILFLKSLVLGE